MKIKRIIVILLAVVIISTLVAPALAYTVPDDTIVYVTPTGEKYHRKGCTHTTSVRSLSIKRAQSSGYEPCSRCRPDIYTGKYVSNWDGSSGGSSSGDSTSVKPNFEPTQPEKEDYSMEWVLLASTILLIFAIWQTVKRYKVEKALKQAEQNLRVLCWERDYDLKHVSEAFSIPNGFTIDDTGTPRALHDTRADADVCQSHTGVYHYTSCRHAYGTPRKIWELKYGVPCKVCNPPSYNFSWYQKYLDISNRMKADGIKMEIEEGIIYINNL